MCLQQFARLVDGQQAAVIGERVDQHRGVFAGFDDLVEIADGAAAHGAGQRPVLPDGFIALQQESGRPCRWR